MPKKRHSPERTEEEIQPLTEEQQVQIHKLYLQFHDSMAAYAKAIVGDWDLAHVVIQATFLDICKKPQRILSAKQPRRWLKQACWLKCKELLRKQKNCSKRITSIDDRLNAEPPVFPEYTFPEDQCRNLGITRAEFDILYRVYVNGEPREKVAKDFDVSKVTLDKRIGRAREKIKKKGKNAETDVQNERVSCSIAMEGVSHNEQL